MLKQLIQQLNILALGKNPIDYARQDGVRIGESCKLLTGHKCFGSEPWLITIGNHVEITSGVRFITHDGGAWVFRDKDPTLDVFGPIVVGDNVFIGVDCIIMPNVTIGSNCVIGAGSVVTKSIPDNSVACGTPARVIKNTDEYYTAIKKRDCGTKGMNIAQKKKAVEYLHAEWFWE